MPIPTIVGKDVPDCGSWGAGVGVDVGATGVAVGPGVEVGVAVGVGVAVPEGVGVGVPLTVAVGVGVAAEIVNDKALQAIGGAAAGLDVGTLGATVVDLSW